ncbi:hypothetical protein EHM76_03620 [bacterium]|nr:MAG: hypothetical protein EHM76_03620 [bacterium]
MAKQQIEEVCVIQNPVCMQEFETIKKDMGELKESIDFVNTSVADIGKRLFIDNGNKCLQSRVNENATKVCILIGICSVLGTAVVGLLLNLLIGVLTK